MYRSHEIVMLEETLRILKQGWYITDSGKPVHLKLAPEQMQETMVFLPEDVRGVSLRRRPAGGTD